MEDMGGDPERALQDIDQMVDVYADDADVAPDEGLL